MIKLLFVLIAALSFPCHALTKTVNGITINASTSYGGALISLKYRNKEYINAYDHGRELQSAVSFDGLGECLNPTQGGSEVVGSYQQTSNVQSLFGFGASIYSGTQMGYWLNPGRYYPQGCGEYPATTAPTYTTLASNVLLNSAYTLGYSTFPNVLVHDITFNVKEAYTKATFEFSTIYMPPTFSNAIFYNPANNTSTNAAGWIGEQTNPVISYTTDQQHAIGIYSKQLPQTQYGSGYGYFGFPVDQVFKMNMVWRSTGIKTNSSHKFQGYYIVGTLEEVKSTMQQLRLQ